MNNWLLFSVLSPAVYTIVNFFDKYILEREITDYRGVPIYAGLMGAGVGTIFWIFSGFQTLPYLDGLIVLVSGILQIWGTALYFRAMAKSETSKLILLFQMLPIFVLIFSFIFLKEIITLKQFIGFSLLLLASIGVSFEKDSTKMKLSSVFYLILACDILWALSAVLMKFAVNATQFVDILSYESWGIALGALALYLFVPSVKVAFIKTQKNLKKSTLRILLGNEGLYILAKSLTFYAYAIGPVALVSVVGGSVQVFFGIVLGSILTFIYPKIFQEDIRKESLVKKSIFAIILCIGTWLVS